MANHLLELFVVRETPLKAEWGEVGASLLTSSARAIHFHLSSPGANVP